jgi:hypothetical protein
MADANQIQRTANEIGESMGGHDSYGFAWTTLLVPVITELLNCLFHNDDVTPDQVQSRVVTMQQRNPQRLQRRAEAGVRKQARAQRRKLTKAEVAEIAKHAIDACCNAPAHDVATAGYAAQQTDWSDSE